MQYACIMFLIFMQVFFSIKRIILLTFLINKDKSTEPNSRITCDWHHALCHKANQGYEKASFTPVPDGTRHKRKSQ